MDHRKAFGLMMAFAVLIAAGLYAFINQERIGPASSHVAVKQIAAFMLEDCEACASVLEAIKEFERKTPGLSFRYYVIGKDSEAMERFKVTEHPAVIFQNEYGQELARLEQDISAESLSRLLAELKAHPRSPGN